MLLLDCNGRPVKLGAVVNLRAKVIRLEESPDFCNVMIQPVHAMPPYLSSHALAALNTAQLEVVEDAAEESV